MEINVPPGKYIIAVSGGVDSMVLLDVLRQRSSLELVVAHFNHGIRPDSSMDEELVVRTAKSHSLPIEVGYGELGTNTSEETARIKRYESLKNLKTKHKADKIITAHHQDDLVETAFINLLRGSGSRGLVAMLVNPEIIRPLTSVKKQQLLDYAKKNGISWREDTTNTNQAYLRNYIRCNVTPLLSAKDRKSLVLNIDKVANIINEKDHLLATISQNIVKNNMISRSKFIALPGEVRSELIMYWLRQQKVNEIDKKTIEKIDVALKTASAGTRHSLKKGLWLKLDIKTAQFDTSL
jgi:tRNA(Ile)-lysidine synthetase-like protein